MHPQLEQIVVQKSGNVRIGSSVIPVLIVFDERLPKRLLWIMVWFESWYLNSWGDHTMVFIPKFFKCCLKYPSSPNKCCISLMLLGSAFKYFIRGNIWSAFKWYPFAQTIRPRNATSVWNSMELDASFSHLVNIVISTLALYTSEDLQRSLNKLGYQPGMVQQSDLENHKDNFP